ncbi:2-dehydro-3-deoxy-D-gluconate 5-dehydrogenase KduD [Aliishimia ponticola]|uniref:2-dehydro-3-deoxy-D-gluconate 5-dehydrogenase KduD n=1 Tax=Aliishimia ponticola TaxID=2499833 RepID=A0A4V3XKF0_9RHOB|nr:2-dehydro-3-deoxy-D-gluconate 5-dehydrogenase KduD [Aliishimia ponticola]THH36673.1 2-dehydro-3-deoxy-D-gluconate 5-dehydrogenase KduD [Aliishimia ponticola]
MKAFDLTGKTALVTGANTGIGQAIAIGLGEAGAHVICAARRACDETLSRIDSGAHLALDLSDPMAARDVFADQHIDILINNAGIIRREDSIAFSEADWDDVMDVNLKAVFFTCQAFAKAVLARSGSGKPGTGKIVNIASLLSFQGGIRVPSYTASKHGVAGVTKILANEWAAQGINVNAIAPGYIATNNTEALRADAARNAAILERIPAGRWGDAADIANTAVYLSAPASDYVHGAVLNVDGGWLAR